MYYGELWEEDGDFAWHDYVNETQWTTMWSDGTPYKRSQAMTWRPIMLSMGGLGAAACPAPGVPAPDTRGLRKTTTSLVVQNAKP